MSNKRIVKITIEYDGTNYSGWQVQPNAVTIQGKLEEAVKRLTGEETKVYGAGRTDAGVHARGQVATFKTNSDIPIENFARALTSRLPKDISVREAQEVNEGFDPRHGAKMKLYRYQIYASNIAPAIGRHYMWHTSWELNIEKMKEASKYFEGRHDYTSFSNQECNNKEANNIRTVTECNLDYHDNIITIDVMGRAFLYNMVRNIVGTLVDVGRGRIQPADIPKIFAARNRQLAGQGAPANGLTLEWIKYEQSEQL